MKHFALAFLLLFVAKIFAYDGDMDIYHEFKEDLALVRDSYLSSINMAIEDASQKTDGTLDGWFEVRNNGKAKTWSDIDFEAPDLKWLKISEIPYGFTLKGSHGAYKIDAIVKVVTRDTDIFYDIKFQKTTNAAGKDIFGEVFRNDRVIFYDENTPCKRESVTCIDEYSRGTELNRSSASNQ